VLCRPPRGVAGNLVDAAQRVHADVGGQRVTCTHVPILFAHARKMLVASMAPMVARARNNAYVM
jgi:hypothetical protein